MLKIEKLPEDVQNKIIKMKAQGMSYSDIAQKINEDYNQDLKIDDVYKYFFKREDKAILALKDSKKMQKKFAERYFDAVTELNALFDSMKEEFYKLKDDPKYKEKLVYCPKCGTAFKTDIEDVNIKIKLADHLLSEIKHVDAVLGKIQKKSLNITYNVPDLTQKLVTVIPQLYEMDERKGNIKIKKKRKMKQREKI